MRMRSVDVLFTYAVSWMCHVLYLSLGVAYENICIGLLCIAKTSVAQHMRWTKSLLLKLEIMKGHSAFYCFPFFQFRVNIGLFTVTSIITIIAQLDYLAACFVTNSRARNSSYCQYATFLWIA